MKGDMTMSQIWLPEALDRNKFIRAFEEHFYGGKAQHIPLVRDAHPRQVPDGAQFFEVATPTARMGEFWPFMALFAAEHGYNLNLFPASGFGYSHSG